MNLAVIFRATYIKSFLKSNSTTIVFNLTQHLIFLKNNLLWNMSTWDEDIITAFENLGGIANYEELYSEIRKLRENLPPTWKSVIRRRIQDLSSDSVGFKGSQDLFFSVEGLGRGIWGLRSHLSETPKAYDLPSGVNESRRTYLLTYRVLRDTSLARKIKALHRNKCQICRKTIEFGNGESYAEAHHIIPLGKPHNGPDIAENIIVLCPNHHALCDLGGITLSLDTIFKAQGHSISEKSIKYHNQKIALKGK